MERVNLEEVETDYNYPRSIRREEEGREGTPEGNRVDDREERPAARRTAADQKRARTRLAHS